MTYDVDAHRITFSPMALARTCGALYLVVIVLGIFGEAFVRGRIIVPGDAAATADHLRSMESLWRVGIASEFVLLVCASLMTAIFYVLFRPVSRVLALMKLCLNVVSISVEAVSAMDLIAALFPLGRATSLSAFTPEQLNGLAMMSLRAHGNGFGVALLFFGVECVIIGWLIIRSGYFPKAIGVLMQIAGVCYVTNSFALLLSPALANVLFPAILLPAFIGELSLCLWLLIKGVNVERYTALAAAS